MLFSKWTFEFFQRFGIHVTRNHFYEPIPSTRQLAQRPGFWESETTLLGIDINLASQLDLLRNVFPRYLPECDFPLYPTDVPHQYY